MSSRPQEPFVALLRGVNVGRAKRVPMADLRRIVAGLGFAQPRTLLNSGNVVFSASDVEPGEAARRIEAALLAELGVPARTIVLRAPDIAAAIDGNALAGAADNPSRLLVAFLATATDARKVEALLGRDWAPEALALGSQVAYLWCPGGVAESPLATAVGKTAGEAITARNWTTVLKLRELLVQQSGEAAR